MQSNQKPLVSFEQAKGLKALGFDWECEFYFMEFSGNVYEFSSRILLDRNASDETFSGPTISQAIRFFRIEKGVPCGVTINVNELKFTGDYMYDVVKPNGKVYSVGGFDTYDLAASALLDKLIELNSKGHDTL